MGMVVHQFGDILKARIEDLGKRCKEDDSSKEVLAAAVLTAEKNVETAAGHQMEAADVFTAENDAYSAKMKSVRDLKKAVRDKGGARRKCESSLAQLKIKLDQFQKGPLEAFEKLQCRKQETSEDAVTAVPESEATAVSVQDTEAAIVEAPAVSVQDTEVIIVEAPAVSVHDTEVTIAAPATTA